MKRLTIPRVLTVATLSLAACSPPAPPQEAGTDAQLADARADTAPDDGSPVCRYDPSRPASDPCERANLMGGICTFNRDADGGVECMYFVT